MSMKENVLPTDPSFQKNAALHEHVEELGRYPATPTCCSGRPKP